MFGGSITVTPYGHVYVAPQGGAGVPGVGAGVRGGWVDQSKAASCQSLDTFVHGKSYTASGYAPVIGGFAGPSGGETNGNVGGTHSSDFATEVGGGVGLGKFAGFTRSYGYRLPFNIPGWR
jgi:hypothetical protein